MISRNKITISFISYADKDETKKAIKDKIIPKLYDYIWLKNRYRNKRNKGG